jgi:phosphoribosylanthranilate isomerase
MPPLIKICGFTEQEDCEKAVELRIDYAGLVFPESSRRVSLERARELRKYLVGVKRVALFVNEDPGRVEEVAEAIGAHAVQLHGDPRKEGPEYCARFMERWYVWKAFNEETMDKIPHYTSVDAIVFDACVKGKRGGTGEVADWDKALKALRAKELAEGLGISMVLAGGLTPKNVAEAIRKVNPWAVDVSSGVEGKVKGKNMER